MKRRLPRALAAAAALMLTLPPPTAAASQTVCGQPLLGASPAAAALRRAGRLARAHSPQPCRVHDHADRLREWARMTVAVFGAADAPAALCVMAHESGGRPGAVNGPRGDRETVGLMQIAVGNLGGANRVEGLRAWAPRSNRAARADLLNPLVNLTAARDLMTARGWRLDWRATARHCM